MAYSLLYNFLITSKPIMIYIMLYIRGIYTVVYIYPTDKQMIDKVSIIIKLLKNESTVLVRGIPPLIVPRWR
jgi:hypothetical protein